MRMEYKCEFFLEHFPFDHQLCHFIMKFDVNNNVTLAFVKDSPAIMYKGPAIVDGFRVAGDPSILDRLCLLAESVDVLVG